jgi:hypothetical protein
MVQHFKSYLRPVRRRWGFTQAELAFLLGFKTGKGISRIEALKQTPALGCGPIVRDYLQYGCREALSRRNL